MHGVFKMRAGRRRRRRDPWQLRQRRREVLLGGLVLLFAEAEPTVFALEGPSLAWMRAQLCLEGWPWQAAHAAAGDLVGEALRRIGAERPAWREGQREVTLHEPRTRCANPECERTIANPESRRAYCSTQCQVHTHNLRRRANNPAKYIAMGRAWWEAKRAAAPLVPCENCGKPFRAVPSGRGTPTNCSGTCAATSRNRRLAQSRRWREIEGAPSSAPAAP